MSLEELKTQLFENRRALNNAAVQLLEVNVMDPDNPSHENDYAIAALLHDAFGLKAEFGKNGSPTTEIRFQINPTESARPDRQPPSIAKLTRRHGRWKPIPIGGIVILEDAFMHAKTGIVHADWMKTGVRDFLSGTESCVVASRDGIPNLMTVERERRIGKRDGTYVQRQNRYRVHQLEATGFKGISQFKENAIRLLDIEPDIPEGLGSDIRNRYDKNFDGRGIPCVAFRGIALDEEYGQTLIHSFAKRIECGWNREKDRRMTPEEAVNSFLKGTHNSDWVEEIRKSSSIYEDTFYELLPMQRYNTDGKNLPSNPSQPSSFDDSIDFQSPVLNEYNDLDIKKNGQPKIGTGFSPSIMLSVRRGAGAEHPWYARRTLRIDYSAPIAPLSEIPTPNLPDQMATHLYERAEKRLRILEDLEEKHLREIEAGTGIPEPGDSEGNAENNREPDDDPGFTP